MRAVFFTGIHPGQVIRSYTDDFLDRHPAWTVKEYLPSEARKQLDPLLKHRELVKEFVEKLPEATDSNTPIPSLLANLRRIEESRTEQQRLRYALAILNASASGAPDEHEGPWPIIVRFGIPPAWAFERLRDAGDSIAQDIERSTDLAMARLAGAVAGVVVAVLTAIAAMVAAGAEVFAEATSWVFVGASLVLCLGATSAWYASQKNLRRRIEQFYPDVARLLDLRRFDLYRALNLRPPQSTEDELSDTLDQWRLGLGGPAYQPVMQPEPATEVEISQKLDNLTDRLSGPKLVDYHGYLSWEPQPSAIKLTFAGTPEGSDQTRQMSLDIEGITARTAPFELEANSRDVDLRQVRASVDAPTNGRRASVSFDFTRRTDASEPPTVWIEIRQRGRFVRLIRIELPPHGL